jgi:predicted nucleic acid-binding protein
MKTLFVDTNILLSFYHLTSEDLEELRKLVALIDTAKIKLVLTEQVKDEFKRNRSAKIADAMKKLQEARFKISFPAFAKDYSGYDELRTLLDKAGKKHAELVEMITEDAIKGDLKADALVADLFKKATVIPVSDRIYLNAMKRVRLGNPPGKENSLGDAVNWECLLVTIDDFADVHLVSEDKDYRSQLSPEFSEFLNEEWEHRKTSKIFFYARISDFFKTNFPNIKIASEVERDLLVEELRNSGSFATTHLVMARLLKHTDFSPLQIDELVQIARSNSQIGWIVGDPDVHSFYASLLKSEGELSPEVAAQLNALVEEGDPAPSDDDGIPL